MTAKHPEIYIGFKTMILIMIMMIIYHFKQRPYVIYDYIVRNPFFCLACFLIPDMYSVYFTYASIDSKDRKDGGGGAFRFQKDKCVFCDDQLVNCNASFYLKHTYPETLYFFIFILVLLL